MELNTKLIFYMYLITTISINYVLCIRCYQCGSSEDDKTRHEDNCGAYKKFDKKNHIAIDCNSEESHMPGSFCMKMTQQSPKGFIWDGRWRQVIRRCASVADTGVTGVCNWGVYNNGVYWQECYCTEDECNSGVIISISQFLITLSIGFILWWTFQS